MYIQDREKIEKLLSSLVKELVSKISLNAIKKKLNLILKMLGNMRLSKCWKR